MILADWIALAMVVVFLALGALIGFGKGLKFFTSGIFGIVISVLICALIGTVFLDVGFVGDLLGKLAENWAHIEFLKTIHLEVITYYVIMFVIVQIARIIVVVVIKQILESENILMKIVNKSLGAVFFLGLGFLIVMLIVKIIGWVGGDTAMNLYNGLAGSVFRLDVVFEYMDPEWAEKELALLKILLH